MKLIISTILMVATCVILCGCPYSSPYGIDAVANIAIDDDLLGNWETLVSKPSDEQHLKSDPVQISFTKYTDLEYSIAISGGIKELLPYRCMDNEIITGTAYLSTIDKKRFLNAFIKGRMYIAEVIKSSDGLSIQCLAERFTAKYIKSSEQLRSALTFHYKVAIYPAYDNFFVLKNLMKIN